MPFVDQRPAHEAIRDQPSWISDISPWTSTAAQFSGSSESSHSSSYSSPSIRSTSSRHSHPSQHSSSQKYTDIPPSYPNAPFHPSYSDPEEDDGVELLRDDGDNNPFEDTHDSSLEQEDEDEVMDDDMGDADIEYDDPDEALEDFEEFEDDKEFGDVDES